MPLHHERLPSSNDSNKRNLALRQNTSPTSEYSYPNTVDSSYVSLLRSSPHGTDLQDCTYDEEASRRTVSRSYRESSQRTSIRDSPYSSGYDPVAENRYAGTMSAHEGTPAIYKDLTDAGQTQADPTTQFLLVTHPPSVTERPDVFLFPLESSKTQTSHPPPGADKSMFPQGTSYFDTGTASHSNSPMLPPSRLEHERSQLSSVFQMGSRSQSQFSTSLELLPDDSSQHVSHAHPGAYTPQSSNLTAHFPSTSSIPMRNNPREWSSAPLDGATRAQISPQHPSNKVLKRSSTCMTPAPDSPTLTSHSVSYVGHSTPEILPLSSPAISSLDPPTKRKKSKMHECEVCGKQFPRPSGLQTHMNTHNNVKPFSCGFPGCSRAFAVRSNATRHLRTHGAIPAPAEPPSTPYVVNFSTPTVIPSSLTRHEMEKAPYKLRWMPQSLTTRTNAEILTSMSDTEYESDDTTELSEIVDWRSALSIPLRPVVPFTDSNDVGAFEERNSYLNAKSHPYHPSQYTILPGPAICRPTSTT